MSMALTKVPQPYVEFSHHTGWHKLALPMSLEEVIHLWMLSKCTSCFCTCQQSLPHRMLYCQVRQCWTSRGQVPAPDASIESVRMCTPLGGL